MGFRSLLGEDFIRKEEDKDLENITEPGFFVDLNLDQVIEYIIQRDKVHDLKKYYYMLPKDKDTILYRQEVLKDIENEQVHEKFIEFSQLINKAKEHEENSKNVESEIQKQRWNLDCAYYYIQAINKCRELLKTPTNASKAFRLLQDWLDEYTADSSFKKFEEDAMSLMEQCNRLQFSLKIEREKISIKPEPEEESYCKNVCELFHVNMEREWEAFDNPLSGVLELSMLEYRILYVLKKYRPEIFKNIKEFSVKYKNFIHPVFLNLEKEFQFYHTFLLYKKEMMHYGFSFCYPDITEKDFETINGYDAALALKNISKGLKVISNEGIYENQERFFIVTGPNQGGKTTYARALGQIVYFSLMGLTPPCQCAKIPLFQGIISHFSQEESLETGAGKLKEELVRLNPMMLHEYKNYFVIINELFTTAASYDAYIMGRKVIDHFVQNECFGVYVTHISELAKESEQIVSLVASVDEEDDQMRTYKIYKKEADGKGYANGIALKHRLSYAMVKKTLMNR